MSRTTGAQSNHPRSRRWRYLGIVLGVIVLTAAGGNYWWGQVNHRLEEMSPGALWKSGAMPPEELVATCRRLGIKTVIDLRTAGSTDPEQPENVEDVKAEGRALAAAGLTHVHIPSEQVPDDATVDRYLAAVSNATGQPFLVHCHHGTGRAELFSAIYRIEVDGWDYDRARRATRWIPYWSSFSPNKPKGQYLLQYK